MVAPIVYGDLVFGHCFIMSNKCLFSYAIISLSKREPYCNDLLIWLYQLAVLNITTKRPFTPPHTHTRARESARELPPLVCHMTIPMLHLVFLMITCNFATTFIGELREGIGRHWRPEGGMMACSYIFSDMTAFALFIIFLCTITWDIRLNKVSLQSCQYIAPDTHSILHSIPHFS